MVRVRNALNDRHITATGVLHGDAAIALRDGFGGRVGGRRFAREKVLDETGGARQDSDQNRHNHGYGNGRPVFRKKRFD